MSTELLAESFETMPLVPIVKAGDVASTLRIIDALVEAGVAAVEIVLRTDGALPTVKAASLRHPGLLVGVGTILEPCQIDDAIEAGARFGVSPGSTSALAKAAQARQFCFVPGTQTASEVMHAKERGFRLLKYYPAAPTNGEKVLDDYGSIFPDIGFMPTGRITIETISTFASLSTVVAIGGSFMHGTAESPFSFSVISENVSQAKARFWQAKGRGLRAPDDAAKTA